MAQLAETKKTRPEPKAQPHGGTLVEVIKNWENRLEWLQSEAGALDLPIKEVYPWLKKIRELARI